MSRTTPSRRAATARSSSSPTPWPSVSLIDLKLSRSTNSAATGVWLRRERTSICSTRSRISVRFGRPVSASWVARNASSSWRRVELLVGALALGLEGLAHPHERHVEAALQHPERPVEHLGRDIELRGGLAQHLVGRVAPAQAALGDLVQRRLALGGEMAEDPPRLLPDLARHVGALAGHPARDRERGDRADAHEAALRRPRRAPGPSRRERRRIPSTTSSVRALSASPRRRSCAASTATATATSPARSRRAAGRRRCGDVPSTASICTSPRPMVERIGRS